ncbi:hypothetical protein PISMIDRAFT_689679 [Pisolithus microcarpus 441]|uniref:Uncharacterized protein n=1 Tax=Pisolithus microcarpus 441 TaxID=765257 RepID=A0A0C9YE83_9AGAM|nr:hypothetical protein PISMIDRAFT_689679 [Pisolithus microcarpus 441]
MQPPPSPTAKSDDYITIQAGDQKILDCRYVSESYETVAPPIQLLNPAFAYFTSKAFDPEHAVSPAFVNDVRDLVESSAVIHATEFEHRNYLKPIIQKIVDHPTISVSSTNRTAPDGVVDGHTRSVPLVIYEEKKEFGGAGLDPSTQGSLSYQRVFFPQYIRDLDLETCCPAFIIARAGPWLSILGGITTTRCVVQRLSDYLWLPLHSTCDDDHWFRIARVLHVLNQSIERLRLWYENNRSCPTNSRVLPILEFSPLSIGSRRAMPKFSFDTRNHWNVPIPVLRILPGPLKSVPKTS